MPDRFGQSRCFFRTKRTGPFRAPVQPLSADSLRGETLDPALLPAGVCAVFSGTVRFLPEASSRLLPDGFVWQGLPLGRLRGSGFQADSRLRVLMPKNGQRVICDSVQEVRSLLQGCSIPADASLKNLSCAGLWWRDLPLGRVGIRSGRVISSFQR